MFGLTETLRSDRGMLLAYLHRQHELSGLTISITHTKLGN